MIFTSIAFELKNREKKRQKKTLLTNTCKNRTQLVPTRYPIKKYFAANLQKKTKFLAISGTTYVYVLQLINS